MTKNILATVAVFAAALISMPAAANEGRAEVRGGMVFAGGGDDEIAGIAFGYDFDLSDTLFIGAEATADKILVSRDGFTFGGNARLGASLNESVRAYAIGGYNSSPCDDCFGAWSGGVGAEYNISEDVYLKTEYRHFFVGDGFDDYDAVVIGIGIAVE